MRAGGSSETLTTRGTLQPETLPVSSIAWTRTLKFPDWIQLWVTSARVPEGSKGLVVDVPSPQSKTYWIRSPLLSVVEAKYE